MVFVKFKDLLKPINENHKEDKKDIESMGNLKDVEAILNDPKG